MIRAGVTVTAAVLAAAVRVDARSKTDVGAVVVRDDRDTGVSIEPRLRRRIVRLVSLGIPFVHRVLEAVRRIFRRPTSANGLAHTHQHDGTMCHLFVNFGTCEVGRKSVVSLLGMSVRVGAIPAGSP